MTLLPSCVKSVWTFLYKAQKQVFHFVGCDNFMFNLVLKKTAPSCFDENSTSEEMDSFVSRLIHLHHDPPLSVGKKVTPKHTSTGSFGA